MASSVKHGILFFILAVAVTLTGQPVAADGIRYRDEVFPSVASRPRHRLRSGNRRVRRSRRRCYLDLYQPVGDTEPLRPAFVWIHGGGFTGGDKASVSRCRDRHPLRQARLRHHVDQLPPARGRIASSPATPRLPQAIFDAQHDAQASIRWLRANAAAYGIDAEPHRRGRFLRRGDHLSLRHLQLRRRRR